MGIADVTPLTDLQKVSATDETEIRSRAPPPARPSAAPHSPSSTMSPASTPGNPFASADDNDIVEAPEHSDTNVDNSSTANDDVPGNPFEEEDGEVASIEPEPTVEVEKDSEPEEKVKEPEAAPEEESASKTPPQTEPVPNEPTVCRNIDGCSA